MKFITKITVVFVILGTFLISSCLKPEEFANEPKIEFVSFEAQGDSSGIFVISFTDGDGDIGLDIGDTLTPFEPNSYYYYNVYFDYYEIVDGDTVRGTSDPNGNNFPTADPITLAFRIENITPIGQNKALKGEIKTTLEPRYYNFGATSNDSILYKIVLIDRALNISNELITPIITR